MSLRHVRATSENSLEIASIGLGGRVDGPAAGALLARGKNRTVLLFDLLLSLVVLHFCGGFCGLPVARHIAAPGSSEGIPVSHGLVGASLAAVRGGQPAHSKLVLCD